MIAFIKKLFETKKEVADPYLQQIEQERQRRKDHLYRMETRIKEQLAELKERLLQLEKAHGRAEESPGSACKD